MGGGWQVHFYDEYDHVVPLRDWMVHVDRPDCSCHPNATPWEGKTVYVHHAADMREYSESDFDPQFSTQERSN